MKDYVYNPKKKDQTTITTLNALIYDYLVKMKFEKSANTFACEAYIADTNLTDGPPVLSQWFAAFQEISNVRCGMPSSSTDLSRIEGIMLKLENEKKRYQQMGKMEHMPYYNMHRDPHESPKPHNMYYPPHYYNSPTPMDHPPMHIDQRKQVEMRNMQMYGRQRYEDFQNIGMKGQPRFDPSSKPISPKLFNKSPDVKQYSPDRIFILREISEFIISEHNVIHSVLSKEHNILFNVYQNRSIGAFNCSTMKNECIVETNGKQITNLRIEDTLDFIWVVASYDTNELMVIRYLIQEAKFEMAGILREHSDKIISFDVNKYIYSLDASGNFKKWNFNGVPIREEILTGNVQKMYAYLDNHLILSDATRTYLYDCKANMEASEICNGPLVTLKRHESVYILVFKDKVVIYGNENNKIKTMSIPNNSVKSACIIDNDIISGSSQDLWYFEGQGRLKKIKISDDSEIISVENINKYKENHILVITSTGNCIIVSKCYSE